MPPVVWISFLVINLVGAVRERAVTHEENAVRRQAAASYPYLTCRDMFGHAFPNDSIRQRDLMLAIGCANGNDTTKVARVERTEVESHVVDSLVARIPRRP